MVRGKRGILRIIEAGIAVLIVLGAIIAVSFGGRETASFDLSETIPPLLEEMAKNTTLRDRILSYNTAAPESDSENQNIIAFVNGFLEERISNPFLEYRFRVCEPNKVCGLDEYPSDSVFAGERIISADFSMFSPKKAKVFIWQRAQ
jgi:hypothetical protein